jgi:hypothetical protein
MATYEVTSPDGQTWEVDAPDNATQAQVMAYAKAQWKPKEANAQSPVSAGSRFAAGLMDPIQGGAQMLERAVRGLAPGAVETINKLNNRLADFGIVGRLPAGGVDQQTKEREQALKTDGMDWLRLAGNVVSPVNAAAAAMAPLGAAGLGARMATGAGLGAFSAGMTPNAGGDADKLAQMGMGAFGGAAVPAVTAGIGRMISPRASMNPELGLLRGEGVQPTIGQTLGGTANRIEEKAQSLPIVGDAITAARNRAREQFNNAAINRATEPIGVKIQGVGQSAVDDAHRAASAAYDAGKAKLGFFRLDQQGATELATLKQMTAQLPTKERRVFDGVWTYLQGEISPNGSITAEGFKRIDSKLGQEAAKFGGSQDAYQKTLGDAFKEAKRVVMENAKRANPDAAKMIKAADEAWANLVRVENASKKAMNTSGMFTPGQLQQAVRESDRSVRKNMTARGEALLQDLSGAGQSVLGNKYPDSGTAGRMFLGGGALASGLASPAIPLGLLGGAAAYAPAVQGLLRGAVTARPNMADPIARLFNQASPMLSPAGGLFASDLME